MERDFGWQLRDGVNFIGNHMVFNGPTYDFMMDMIREIDRLKKENHTKKMMWNKLKEYLPMAAPREWERVLRSMEGIEKESEENDMS